MTVVGRELDAITLRYASSAANFLRVAIPMYPGWHATLKGSELSILSADDAFMAVEVPPGSGDVRLAYWPRLFWLGSAVSAVALIAAVAALTYQKARGPSSA